MAVRDFLFGIFGNPYGIRQVSAAGVEEAGYIEILDEMVFTTLMANFLKSFLGGGVIERQGRWRLGGCLDFGKARAENAPKEIGRKAVFMAGLKPRPSGSMARTRFSGGGVDGG
jgi:hypothetical protein